MLNSNEKHSQRGGRRFHWQHSNSKHKSLFAKSTVAQSAKKTPRLSWNPEGSSPLSQNRKKIEYFKDFSTAFNALKAKFNLNYI